jgi:3-phosphoshikimate 1-carboxyvinyltransferase
MTCPLVVPASKSMTQRGLIIASLCETTTRLERPLRCDDSSLLVRALQALGCRIEVGDDWIEVEPAPLVAPDSPIGCGNAGTVVRFATCLSLLCEGELLIDGDEPMRRRPIGPLGTALTTMGVEVTYLGRSGCPPLRLSRRQAPPSTTSIDGSLSSQYASGLAMVAPCLPQGLTIALQGQLVSLPYLDMTIAMMRQAGAQVSRQGAELRIDGTGYGHPGVMAIERDWSAAAFLLAAAHILDRDIDLIGLPSSANTLQGDGAFPALLAQLEDNDHSFDLTDTPDLIGPLTVACLFAKAPSEIRGVAHGRVKECDRLAVLCRELTKIGATLNTQHDGLDVTPLATIPKGRWSLDPEGDHRMAMTFAVLSLRVPGIEVSTPSCVDKSFPDFWHVLDQFRSG